MLAQSVLAHRLEIRGAPFLGYWQAESQLVDEFHGAPEGHYQMHHQQQRIILCGYRPAQLLGGNFLAGHGFNNVRSSYKHIAGAAYHKVKSVIAGE